MSSGLTSVDGYIADERGDFGWGAPDAAVLAFVDHLGRSIRTYLYGRRMFEVMRYWERAHEEPDRTDVERDYTSAWQAADKVVFSTTFDADGTKRTRLERSSDVDAVRDQVQNSTWDVSISGLAAHAFRAGPVDEVRPFLHPVVVGGGTRCGVLAISGQVIRRRRGKSPCAGGWRIWGSRCAPRP
ncbi:dihydrofolate reductase family protein [Agromyces bauzanensis]